MFNSILNVFKKDSLESIHVNDLDNLLGKIELIDVREPYEYAQGSIKTAKNIPMNKLFMEPQKYLKKENTYYIICQSGMRSQKTARALANQGYHVINVAGGVGSYVGTKRTKA